MCGCEETREGALVGERSILVAFEWQLVLEQREGALVGERSIIVAFGWQLVLEHTRLQEEVHRVALRKRGLDHLGLLLKDLDEEVACRGREGEREAVSSDRGECVQAPTATRT